MQGRLLLDTNEKLENAAAMGIDNPGRIYNLHDMAHGDVMFAATGITHGNLLSGVRFERDQIVTNSLVMRSTSRTIREVTTRHPV